MAPKFYAYRTHMTEEFPFKIELRHSTVHTRQTHAHENLQICYVTKGSCVHWINGKHAVAVKGDIFSIPPYLEHRICPYDDKDLELIQIDFMPFFINEQMRGQGPFAHFVDFAYIQPLVSRETLLPKLNLSMEGQSKVEQLIDSMRQELAAKEEGYPLSIKADLLKLLVIVGREFRNYMKGTRDRNAISIHRQALHDAIRFMETHFDRNIRLEDAADIAHMSPSYFSSVFKMVKGTTFIEYMSDIRIRRAMQLLIRSQLSVTDIGYRVGYNHISHFNKMFKKMTGLTPTKYRKAHRIDRVERVARADRVADRAD